MTLPLYLTLPLAAAVLYTIGSIFQKRALHAGASVRQVFHTNNLCIAAAILPLVFFEKQSPVWTDLHQPLLAGAVFYAGALFNTIAIRRGDISLVNPLLGTKAVFVAIGSAILIGEALPPALWAGAILASIGIFVLGAKSFAGTASQRHLLPAIGLAITSASCFALTDVLVSKWAPGFARISFVVIMSTSVAAYSITLNPLLLPGTADRRRLRMAPAESRLPMALGGLIIGTQAMLIAIALSNYNDPTGINIVYSSRGLWSVVLVWVFASTLGANETGTAASGRSPLPLRLAGTAILTAGIIVAVLARSEPGLTQ